MSNVSAQQLQWFYQPFGYMTYMLQSNMFQNIAKFFTQPRIDMRVSQKVMPFSWVQEQLSMEDVVKLSTWMRGLSPLYWCLCVVKHWYAERGQNWLARFSTFRLSSFQPHERGCFKKPTLCQWRGSENCSD